MIRKSLVIPSASARRIGLGVHAVSIVVASATHCGTALAGTDHAPLPDVIRCDVLPRPVSLAVGDDPQYVALGDIDGDGHLDLAVVNAGSASVSVLRGLGDGMFEPLVTLVPPLAPLSVGFGDFDGDGFAELVVGVIGSILVYRSNGDGTFAPPEAYASSIHVGAQTVVDLDGDGHLDIVTAAGNTSSTGSPRLFFNDGNGAFPSFVTLPGQGASGAHRKAIAFDFDGDGILDIASAQQWGGVNLYRGLGDRQFAPAGLVSIGNSAFGLAAIDFDDDGDLDLAVGGGTQNALFLLENDGAGVFTVVGSIPFGEQIRWVEGADLDGDGLTDLAVTTAFSEAVIVLRNTLRSSGAATFSRSAFIAGRDARALAIGDVNGDGLPDLVSAATDGASARVLLNLGAGGAGGEATFRSGRWYRLFSQQRDAATGDLTGNGLADLVIPRNFLNRTEIVRNLGHGQLEQVEPIITNTAPNAAAIGDMDGDGRRDIVLATGGVQNYIAVTRQLIDGSFGAPSYYGPNLGNSAGARRIVAADFDQDGLTDVAAIVAGQLAVFRNLGQAVLASPTLYTPATDGELVIGDMNGDGHGDILNAGFADGVVLRFNDREGGFDTWSFIPNPSGASNVGIGDVDGDGDLDVAISAQFSPLVRVYRNNGDGTFGSPTVHAVGSNSIGIRLLDLDLDGLSDIVVANASLGQVRVLWNDGDGGFENPQEFPTNSGLRQLAVDDFNGDGTLDLLTVATASTVTILENLRPFADDDGDGVPNCLDVCPGGDDTRDRNGNGIPDHCETPCLADLNRDGSVDGADLGLLLVAWGDCPGCPADLDGDGIVDGVDLGLMLNSWGACSR